MNEKAQEYCILTHEAHKWKNISILCGYDWCENCGAFREQSMQGDTIHIPHIIDLFMDMNENKGNQNG